MIANAERQGSTTMSTLRNAFMGDPPGHSYKNNVNVRQLGRQEYRMTLIVGVQPGRAGALLEDYHSGTLQRFQWFPGFDPRCTRRAAKPEGFLYPLALPEPSRFPAGQRTIKVPAGAVEAILDRAERRAQGQTDAVDGHEFLIQERFAVALALLDDRIDMDDDDWRLAGIAMDVSRATRQWVTGECAKAQAEIEERRGRRQGQARSAAQAAKTDADNRKVAQCAQRILNRLGKVGMESMRNLQRNTARDGTTFYHAAIGRLRAEKLIDDVVDPTGKLLGYALSQQT